MTLDEFCHYSINQSITELKKFRGKGQNFLHYNMNSVERFVVMFHLLELPTDFMIIFSSTWLLVNQASALENCNFIFHIWMCLQM